MDRSHIIRTKRSLQPNSSANTERHRHLSDVTRHTSAQHTDYSAAIVGPTTLVAFLRRKLLSIKFFIRNGFTLHVSGDNLTHHQEYNAVYGHT